MAWEARQSGFVYAAQGVTAVPRANRTLNIEGVYRQGGRLMPTAEDLAVISNPESAQPRPRLFDEVRRRLRGKHRSLRKEQAYLHWIRRYMRINGRRHLCELDGERSSTPERSRTGLASSTGKPKAPARTRYGAAPGTYGISVLNAPGGLRLPGLGWLIGRMDIDASADTTDRP